MPAQKLLIGTWLYMFFDRLSPVCLFLVRLCVKSVGFLAFPRALSLEVSLCETHQVYLIESFSFLGARRGRGCCSCCLFQFVHIAVKIEIFNWQRAVVVLFFVTLRSTWWFCKMAVFLIHGVYHHSVFVWPVGMRKSWQGVLWSKLCRACHHQSLFVDLWNDRNKEFLTVAQMRK